MADPAKSDEIEDVLSSIRRLVSEHQPAARAEAPAGPPKAQAAETPDKLILTPALRVTDPEDPWVPITPRAEDAAGGEADPEPAREDEADWARELWGDAEEDAERADEPDPQLQADQWEDGDHSAEIETETGVLDASPEVTEAAQSDAAGTGPEGADESGEPEAPPSFIRSTASVKEYEPGDDNDALTEDDIPVAMRQLAEARGAHGAEAPVRAPEPEGGRVKVQILRAAHDTKDGPEQTEPPQGAGADEIAGGPQEPPQQPGAPDVAADGSEDGDAATAAGGASDVEDLGETPFSFPDEGDGFVDEAALRGIIAEVVREELQGELGVRMTRNIRKLVRREIRLALASQETDNSLSEET